MAAAQTRRAGAVEDRMSRWVWIGLGIVGVLSLGCLTAWRVGEALTRRADAAAATEASATVPVEVVAAETTDLVETVRVAGSLRARHEADVVADVPGRVVSLAADVGSVVHKGEALARLETTELALGVEQAEAGLAMAEAGRTTAARDLEAARTVAGAGGMSATQLAALEARAATADAQVKQAKAGLGVARARLADATLVSPIDGTVTRRATDLGRMVSPGAPAFTVQDLSGLELVVSVDERVAARLVSGATVGVRSDHVAAIPDGTITSIQPALDAVSKKAEVVIAVASVAGLLSHGTASAVLEVGRGTGVVAVPARAVREDGDGQVVWVVEADKARKVPVTLGLRDGERVGVTGIEAGAQVVVAGQGFLSDGAAVTPKTAGPS
jgi:RND family efflux transporter MFP subunit